LEHARTGRSFTDEELARFIADEVKRAAAGLAEYKRPRRIRIRMEPFEKTSTGKIKRFYTMKVYVIEQ